MLPCACAACVSSQQTREGLLEALTDALDFCASRRFVQQRLLLGSTFFRRESFDATSQLSGRLYHEQRQHPQMPAALHDHEWHGGFHGALQYLGVGHQLGLRTDEQGPYAECTPVCVRQHIWRYVCARWCMCSASWRILWRMLVPSRPVSYHVAAILCKLSECLSGLTEPFLHAGAGAFCFWKIKPASGSVHRGTHSGTQTHFLSSDFQTVAERPPLYC